jgi:subtilisin
MDTLIEERIAAQGYAKVLVALKPEVTAGAATAAAAGTAAAGLEQHFIARDPQQTSALAMAAARFSGRTRARTIARPKVRFFPRLGLALGTVDSTGAQGLHNDARVARVHAATDLRLIRPVAVSPAKPPKTPTWGLKRLNVPAAWNAGFTGKGLVVGHLDTGVDGNHPALKGAIADFAEFDLVGNQVPGAKPHDSGEHGTHTAGTIAGRTTAKGSFGVAPDAQIANALVIEGGQVIDRIIAGMEWIVGKNVRIMSMSLGLQGFTDAFQELIDALRRNNVLPVIAVGNEGPDTSRSPGNYDNVLSVGACAEDDTVADFSGSQTFARTNDRFVPDLVAPGVGVLSCVPNRGFAKMDGTSMATPHVAGLAALLLQARPTASAKDLEEAILASCQRPSSMPEARANRGVPDALRAIQALGVSVTAATHSGRKTASRGRKAASRGRKAASRRVKRKAA